MGIIVDDTGNFVFRKTSRAVNHVDLLRRDRRASALCGKAEHSTAEDAEERRGFWLRPWPRGGLRPLR